MRGMQLSLAFLLVTAVVTPRTASVPALTSATNVSASASYDFQSPGKDINVEVNLNRTSTAWYRSPVWISIGVLALVILVLIVVLATRAGGGSTIVKD
ncbi:MAG: hypothetical protein C5B57_05230 [Blastocatellia bacterium]|nr:MAG: hypothetical protein C5B57_05230 [Blastocatellia bacterium]